MRALCLVALLALAYWPIVHAGWSWDDDSYVTANPVLVWERPIGESFRAIWTPGGTPQYYPLVFTTFWIESRLLGPDFAERPLLFHLVNWALHALSTLLLWRILAMLRVPGAWLAAALFALHPMNVESVAWVSERKNVLSLALALSSIACWTRFGDARDGPFEARCGWYAASLLLLVAAMLAKTTAAAVAPALIVIDLWRRTPMTTARLAAYAPYFAIGVPLGLFTAHVERTLVGANSAEIGLAPLDRLILAPRIALFYLWTFVWPWRLAFIYPRWTIDAAHLMQWIPLAAALAAGVGALLAWHRSHRGPLLLLILFGACLFPALGFIDVYPFRYSFVADHFGYLATIPMAIAAASIATRATRAWTALPRGATLVLALALLATLTARQSTAYRDEETLWRRSLAANPDAWMPNSNLAGILLQQAAEAVRRDDVERSRASAAEAEHFARAATELSPGQFTPWHNLAEALRLQGRRADALAAADRAATLAPEVADVHWMRGRLLEESGDANAAIEAYRRAVEGPDRERRDPGSVAQSGPGPWGHRFALARALQRAGRDEEAVAAYEELLRFKPNEPYAAANLALARARLGRHEAALDAFRIAVTNRPSGTAAEPFLVSILPAYLDLLLTPPLAKERALEALEPAAWLVERTGGSEPISLALLSIAQLAAGEPVGTETLARARAAARSDEQREQVESLARRGDLSEFGRDY